MLLSHTATLLTLYRRGKNSLQAPHRLRFHGVDQGLPMTIPDNAHFCVFLRIYYAIKSRCTLTNNVFSCFFTPSD